MIVDVPDHNELRETAIGWMSLAWRITLDALREFGLREDYVEITDETRSQGVATKRVTSPWHSSRFELNNAISLIQLSMELFLKARIAEVSPYLLIVGDPQTWPRGENGQQVKFADFRTIDASQLCRAANIVGAKPLHKDFSAFFERIRTQRNKIAHLNAGNISVEAEKILVDILLEFGFLFPGEDWVDFRKRYIDTSLEEDYEKEWVHSMLLNEIELAIYALGNQYTKRFFGYDKRKKRGICPKCYDLQSSDDYTEYFFAQRQKDSSIKCAACKTIYTPDEYKRMVEERWPPDTDP